MIRRMKIKASPNLAGGVKRVGIPGKKLPQLSSQVNDPGEPASQIAKTENAFASIDETDTINKDQTTILDENSKFKANLAAKVDKYPNSPIKETGKDHENEIASKIDTPVKSFVIARSSTPEEIISQPASIKSRNKNINPSQTDDSHSKNTISSSSNDSEHHKDFQFLNSQEDKPVKQYVNTNTSLSHSFINEASIGEQTNEEISHIISPAESSRQDLAENLSKANLCHDIDNATKEQGMVNSEVTSSLDAKENEDENISAKSVVSNSTPPKLITQTLRNKISTNLPLVNKISARRAKIKGCPAINKRQIRHPINSSKVNTSDTVEHEHENRVTGLENRDTAEHENRVTGLENRDTAEHENRVTGLENRDTAEHENRVTGLENRDTAEHENRVTGLENRDTAEYENRVTVLENRDTVEHANKVTVLESRNSNSSKKLKVQEIKPLKENSPDSQINLVVNIRESAESKENIDELHLKKTSNKLSHRQPNANKVLYKRKYLNTARHSFNKSEEMKEKRLFFEQKLKFRKKVFNGKLEKNQMTMFDLIFWNPDSNPMPRQDDSDSRIPDSSSAEVGSITSEIIEECNAEEEGLQTVHTKTMETPEASEIEQDETATLAPQVKIGPNGDIILDEQSLVIQTTAAKNRDEFLSRTEVVEEPTESSHYGKWSKKRKRSTEWTRKETARFYKALSTVGTDFSLMETIFHWRSRSELKIKFKKEEKFNRHLIDTALNDCTQFDFTIFDESDYDPEVDRKESKETEKVEAKRRKELEREQKKLEKANEVKRKKEQLKIEKLRKKRLKSLYKKQKKKKVAKASLPQAESTSSTNFAPQEVICEVVFSKSEGNVEEHNHTQDESLNDATSRPEASIPSNSMSNVFINMNTQSQNKMDEYFPISGHSEIVELGSDEGIIISPKPLPCTEGYTSISSFTGEIPVSLSSEMSIPKSGKGLMSASTVAQDEAEGNLVVAPISICPEVHSAVNSDEKSASTAEAEIDEGCQVTAEQHFKEPQQATEKDSIIAQFCIPVEHVQISPSTGLQFVEIETAKGIKEINVPGIGPDTSHIVVLEMPDEEKPSEKIYHFYMVAPAHTSDTSESVSNQAVSPAHTSDTSESVSNQAQDIGNS